MSVRVTQHDLALDEEVSVEDQCILAGVDGSLDGVLDGNERVVDLAILGGSQHLAEAAHRHRDRSGQIRLTEQGLLREGSHWAQVGDPATRPVDGVRVQFGIGIHDGRQ